MSLPTEPLWFYVKDRQKVGPIGWSELRRMASEGLLRPLDMVLRAGETKWLPAAEVAGLFSPTGTANDEATVQVPPPGPQAVAVEVVTAITSSAAPLPPMIA